MEDVGGMREGLKATQEAPDNNRQGRADGATPSFVSLGSHAPILGVSSGRLAPSLSILSLRVRGDRAQGRKSRAGVPGRTTSHCELKMTEITNTAPHQTWLTGRSVKIIKELN
ncbi:hypothetical protein E2C01_041725 [Portunus trituberculatus]|uniref:Uncharacterized protein n=1 Tax=Portunus trituberculatus TaxID=210409 RepID=A0A5B7FRF4_PORTR|nr:hypothetical protein [Portunus trituberculatus]